MCRLERLAAAGKADNVPPQVVRTVKREEKAWVRAHLDRQVANMVLPILPAEVLASLLFSAQRFGVLLGYRVLRVMISLLIHIFTCTSNTQAKSLTVQKQPSGFRPKIQLYKYQLDAVSWMKSVENDPIGTFSACSQLLSPTPPSSTLPFLPL